MGGGVVNVSWDLDDLLKMSSPACPGSPVRVSPCWSDGIQQDVCGRPYLCRLAENNKDFRPVGERGAPGYWLALTTSPVRGFMDTAGLREVLLVFVSCCH